MLGNTSSNPIIANIAATNGRIPIITSFRLPLFRMPWTTYKLMPIGGVIRAVSKSTINKMPNQTGSKPKAITASTAFP